jgi:hypothetical protein
MDKTPGRVWPAAGDSAAPTLRICPCGLSQGSRWKLRAPSDVFRRSVTTQMPSFEEKAAGLTSCDHAKQQYMGEAGWKTLHGDYSIHWKGMGGAPGLTLFQPPPAATALLRAFMSNCCGTSSRHCAVLSFCAPAGHAAWEMHTRAILFYTVEKSSRRLGHHVSNWQSPRTHPRAACT